MEVIDVGSISIEKLIKYILSDNRLKELVRHNSTACFVLAHQIHNPRFYESLILNADTIDATTREYLDFIVFYGNKSGVLTGVRRNRDRSYMERKRITGFSLFAESDHHIADFHITSNIQYSSELANEMRFNPNSIKERYLSHHMTRGATILMDHFGLDDTVLPCLLFVNPLQTSEYFIIPIDNSNPLSSIYIDILKPISTCFHGINDYKRVKRKIHWKKRQIKQAERFIENFPKEFEKVNREIRDFEEESKLNSFKLELELKDIKEVFLKLTINIRDYRINKLECNLAFVKEISNLNSILKGVRRLERKKDRIIKGQVQFNSYEEQIEVKNITSNRLERERKRLEISFEKMKNEFDKEIQRIKMKIEAIQKSVNFKRGKRKSIENELKEARNKLENFDSENILIEENRIRQAFENLQEAGINKNLLETESTNSFNIISAFFQNKVSEKIENLTRDLFICHASDDKDRYIRPLIKYLRSKQVTMWYDEAEIRWGDSIVRKVNEGLRISKFVLVVLSKKTISKKWQNSEIESSLNIEFNSGMTRVLPLVIGNKEEIVEILSHYPILASKLYIDYSRGLDFIYENLIHHLKDRLK